MLKRIIILLVAVTLFSCQKHKKEVARLQAVQDSIQVQTVEKDSLILGFLTEFNEIQANLDSIKELEKMVSVEKLSNVELPNSQKRQIIEDINLLKDLMLQNKAKVASLQRRLYQSNKKVSNVEQMVIQLEKMVDGLNIQIQEKDGEIAQLNEKVSKLTVNIAGLNMQIEEASEIDQQKTEIIEKQISELNTAFYAFGSSKELVDNGIIEKQGGVFGIGKSYRFKKDFNREYFSKVDIREFEKLPLNTKRARIISVHPATSYYISGEKTADTLFIDDPIEFWKSSKYLLVLSN